LLEGKPIEVWGGAQLRDFTYVDDAVEAFLLAAARPEAIGSVFNLGGPPSVTLEQLAAMLVQLNGGGAYIVRQFPGDRRKIDIGDYYADDRLIAKRLGWKPRTDLRTALARTLAFYRRELKHYV
jgi:UDP-glucose 4-epimerase